MGTFRLCPLALLKNCIMYIHSILFQTKQRAINQTVNSSFLWHVIIGGFHFLYYVLYILWIFSRECVYRVFCMVEQVMYECFRAQNYVLLQSYICPEKVAPSSNLLKITLALNMYYIYDQQDNNNSNNNSCLFTKSKHKECYDFYLEAKKEIKERCPARCKSIWTTFKQPFSNLYETLLNPHLQWPQWWPSSQTAPDLKRERHTHTQHESWSSGISALGSARAGDLSDH